MGELIKKYYTIEDNCCDEIVEKKSRFIGNVFHIESEEEAVEIIEKTKKRYWDARHNCYAYILGKNSELMRFSDDGEPQGTAGKPILEVLKGAELTNTLVIVTRYFGGVLLGTGGLVRAYSEATQVGIAAGNIACMKLMQPYRIELDYQSIGKIKYTLNELEAEVTSEEYTDKVTLDFIVPVDDCDRVSKAICEATNGKIILDSNLYNVVYLKSTK